MKFKTAIAAAFAVALSWTQAFGQATIFPPGETCFQATTGVNGMVGLLGSITGGSLYTNGTYGGVSLTGGSGSGVTANITVSGGAVTAVAILNPGVNYVVGDALSASAASIGGTGSGFSVPVASVAINSAVAGGTVGFYVPNTQTFKQTWQDAGETILNQNPVPLDQNGCATIYGVGIYRQILKDSLGNTVWDKLTASPSANGIFWAGQAGGTGNAITVTDSAFALQDGATIQFLARSANTGPTTIAVSGGTPISVVLDTSAGPVALSGGEIGAGNTPMVTYDATGVQFHLVNPSASSGGGGGTTSATVVPPQGYLNLVGQASGDVIQTGDVVGAGTIYYSPFVGNQIPVWNGTVYRMLTFTELTTTLTAAGSPSSAIQDACVFSNNGVPTLAIGPQWTTVTHGSGNRGTGAGTAQITRLNGIWVNANSIIGYNGLSSYTIPANQCTYVGSVSVDVTAGQVSAYRTYGQSRKFGVWNAYNRQPIQMQAGDFTASWTYTSNTAHAVNSNPANSVQLFAGLPEEQGYCAYEGAINNQSLATGQSNGGTVGCGVQTTTSFSGTANTVISSNSNAAAISAISKVMAGSALVTPWIGIIDVYAVEAGVNGTFGTWVGGIQNSMLRANWRG